MGAVVETAASRPAAATPGLGSVATASAGLAALLRLPFVATRLWDHDSVQFALGVERFDLAAHQPHPPGYPLYVGLLKLLAAGGVHPLHGMVILSLLAAAGGAAALVMVTAHLVGGGRRGAAAGLFAGTLYATNPLLWFYGELPLVYAVEGGMTVVVAWAAAGMPGSRRRFLLAFLLLALAGGLRPSTLVLLSPLLLHGVWRSWRRGRLTPGLFLAAVAVAAAGVAAWLLPLLAAAGGPAAYRQLSAAHFGALLPRTSVLYGAGLPALMHNLELLVKWAAQGLFPAAVALAALAMMVPRRIGAGLRLLGSRSGFLIAWAGPPILFFAFFHLTKAGYTLIHLPALLAAAAVLAAPLLAAGSEAGVSLSPRGEDGAQGAHGSRQLAAGRALGSWWVRPAGAATLAAVLGATLFVWGQDREPGSPRWWALFRNEFNRRAILAYEDDLDAALAALRRFPPESTVLVTVELAGGGAAGSEGFLYPWQRHLQWYLPDYLVLYLAPDEPLVASTRGHAPFRPHGREIELPPPTERLIFALSGPTGDRLPLPPAEVILRNDHFLLLAVPLRGEVRVGPFHLHSGRVPEQAAKNTVSSIDVRAALDAILGGRRLPSPRQADGSSERRGQPSLRSDRQRSVGLQIGQIDADHSATTTLADDVVARRPASAGARAAHRVTATRHLSELLRGQLAQAVGRGRILGGHWVPPSRCVLQSVFEGSGRARRRKARRSDTPRGFRCL